MNIVDERKKILEKFEIKKTEYSILVKYIISIFIISFISLIFPIYYKEENIQGILILTVESVILIVLSILLIVYCEKESTKIYKILIIGYHIICAVFLKNVIGKNGIKSYIICGVISLLIFIGILCFYFDILKKIPSIILVVVALFLYFKYITIKDWRNIAILVNLINFVFNAKILVEEVEGYNVKKQSITFKRSLFIMLFVAETTLLSELIK